VGHSWFKYLRVVYVILGPYFLHTNLLIRSFILVKNPFGLPKFCKETIASNIFIFILVQKTIYLKSMQKITAMDVSVSGTIDGKRI